jgi:sodium/hydrogen antiporter
VVIVIASLLSGFVDRTGLPQVAVFLALGAIIGPFGLQLVDIPLNSPILRVVATLSLVLVLFTDAVSLNLSELRSHKKLGVLVLGPGTIVSAAFIGALAGWLLKLPVVPSMMVGAALASTDPVLLRGILRRPKLSTAVKQALRIESGLNDVVLLPIILVGIALSKEGGLVRSEWGRLALDMVVLSPAAGVVVALAAIGALEVVRRQIGIRRDYESIYSLGIAFGSYAAAEAVHGSGFIAAFVAGLTVNALDVELCDCFLEYGETTAEMALLFAFVLLGVSIIWSGLGVTSLPLLGFALLAFAARVAAFLPALAIARISARDRWFIAWFGPRGLSTLLLILLPVFAGVKGSESLLAISCFVVLCSVVIHGFAPMTGTLRRGEPKGETPPRPEKTQAEIQKSAPPKPAPAVEKQGEYIEMAELQSLGEEAVLVDARSLRSYADSHELARDAVRIDPDHPVSDGQRRALPKNKVLAVFCA